MSTVATAAATVATAATTTTTTTVKATTTTSACPAFPTEAGQLFTSYRQEQRGIAGADEASYRRDAEAIRERARAAGCPVPAILTGLLD